MTALSHTASVKVLEDLLGRLEAAEGADRELDLALTLLGFPDTTEDDWLKDELERRAFGNQWKVTASIDASMALVERVLPGWNCSSVNLAPDPCEGYVWMRGQIGNTQGKAKTPALALLCALAKVLIANADGEEA